MDKNAFHQWAIPISTSAMVREGNLNIFQCGDKISLFETNLEDVVIEQLERFAARVIVLTRLQQAHMIKSPYVINRDDMSEDSTQALFKKLKAVCVPLMGSARLSAATTKSTLDLLDQLNALLSQISPAILTPSLNSYIFLPLSTILQRNSNAEIPDQVLERILKAMTYLVESWWWTCETRIWEQIFMLCGAIVGGISGRGGQKARDDETKEAAADCILALLRPRSAHDARLRSLSEEESKDRLFELQMNAKGGKLTPVVGQTLESFLRVAESRHLPLQRSSLEALHLLIDLYLPDQLIPTILPGVVSAMTKVCMALPNTQGWTNGDIVALALRVIQVEVVKSIGDDVCAEDGALHRFTNLDDLSTVQELPQTSSHDQAPAYHTRRTYSWMRGTATQLHIALNSLSPLVVHPTASALQGLVEFSRVVLQSTPLTLPQTQPLLLSFLLSLSLSDYPSVANNAQKSLSDLLTLPSDAQSSLHQTLVENVNTNLSALPRLIATQIEAKTIHVCNMIEAVCRLARENDTSSALFSISRGIGKLLGPTGGIEKWGWSLLSVLDFVEPTIVITHASQGRLALENDPENQEWVPFPDLVIKNIPYKDGRRALENMLHAMGAAGGDSCLFAVEWFSDMAHANTTPSSVAAMWCACRILEGISGISLSPEAITQQVVPNKRLEKQMRAMVRNVAELWDRVDVEVTPDRRPNGNEDDDVRPFVQHQKGLVPLHETLKITRSSTSASPTTPFNQPILHRALCLQLISIGAGIMQSRFDTVFIHALYPVLHSLVSPLSFLSSTALATLNYITFMSSYASPANLLLSNFDYILDSVSRRLSRRWLDIDATKVLALMVRLVGPDVVEKAGDVVEECFDRLDEYHGYGVIVDGLIDVLNEVIRVIEKENQTLPPKKKEMAGEQLQPKARKGNLDEFFDFLPKRLQNPLESDMTDYGPAPKEAWGKKDSDSNDAEGNKPKSNPPKQPFEEEPPTSTQTLTKQIITRSSYFLTHSSPTIRAKVLNLLTLSVPVLPESALLPSVHSIWPFVLNRLRDPETYVVSATAGLVESLAAEVGEFMFRRIWDDIWPIFRSMLKDLEVADSTNALTRRSKSQTGAESAYTHSHRLYRSILRTMTAALKGVHPHEASFWDVLVLFRRFLGTRVHKELQKAARELYIAAVQQNPDAVWLVLTSTTSPAGLIVAYLQDSSSWDITNNASVILASVHSSKSRSHV